MRILFVESDKDLRLFFGSKLKEEFKGTIDIVASCKEAIKLLKTERPYDVIISDYFHVNGSGIDLLNYKLKNKIVGKFIFFCTVRAEMPFKNCEYEQVDKFSFGLLCKLIDRKGHLDEKVL